MDDLLHELRFARLDRLAGTWDTTITRLYPDGSEVGTSMAVDTYRWMPNRKFLVHDVDAEMDGERVQSLEIIAIDPNGTGYHTRSYNADGTIGDFSAALDGDIWTISGQDLHFVGTFADYGHTLSGQWDVRDGLDWRPLMRVSLKKRPYEF